MLPAHEVLAATPKTDLRRFCLRINDWLALEVHKHGPGPDLHVSAPQGLAGQFNELLGVLRSVEERR